jgi:hypothetical protein
MDMNGDESAVMRGLMDSFDVLQTDVTSKTIYDIPPDTP